MDQQVSPQPQISGARTTGTSQNEGRLKVDTGGMKHMILKKLLGKVKNVKIKMKM